MHRWMLRNRRFICYTRSNKDTHIGRWLLIMFCFLQALLPPNHTLEIWSADGLKSQADLLFSEKVTHFIYRRQILLNINGKTHKHMSERVKYKTSLQMVSSQTQRKGRGRWQGGAQNDGKQSMCKPQRRIRTEALCFPL